ncbi:hypothetical protein OF83DRAFT_1166126 [Amylostereum chailletii]|nr:hypothetical protein OF83DRAFT_1166126 [Amylostereum chailletii]
MSSPIVFYDVTRKNEGITDDSLLAVSPNTWRVRYALNIKGIPYKTVWLDYAEIGTAIKAIGAEPSGILPSGEPHYTVPTIYDPSTERIVTDSYEIIDYLEAQYPNTSPLFAPGTRTLQRAFIDTVVLPLSKMIFPVLVFDMIALCTETGAPVWRAARERTLGVTLEEVAAKGERREELISAFLKRLEEIGRWMDANGEGAVFLTGDAPSGADCDLAGWLTLWQRRRFEKYLRAFEKWQIVV